MKQPNTYTASDMITFLQKQEPDAVIILGSDGEGNWSSPLGSTERAHFRFVEGDHGPEVEIGYTSLTPALEKCGLTKDRLLTKEAPKCIIFYPTL